MRGSFPRAGRNFFSRNNKYLHRFIRQLEAERDINVTLRAVQYPCNLCRRALGIFFFKISVQS
jgi:hypothetical protein